ncbi:ATP-binding protein [Aestuariibacter sp. AA17]|uniref:histidine kinase n=1 Tax=Fluctibacter corallii TaxID=2984329 RepID=A0ABT3ADQ9_9ALTE|nr:hybrid sensor histidine kinase/response regulator [Aestuariibacter sp. AA17]MCV2886447.1 ATP-binding protein [Aestuariibacter sp. AA17]
MLNWFLFIFTLLASCTSALAQPSVQLIDSEEVIRLSSHVTMYREDGRELSLQQIVKRTDEFKRVVSDSANYGFHDSGVWLHATFSNVTDTDYWVVDLSYSQLDKVDFYLMSGDDLLAQSSEGKLRPSQQFRFPTLEATLPFATQLDLFVRLETNASNIIAPMEIQSKTVHTRTSFYDTLIWGLFYGGLIILAIYSLILYPSKKEKSMLAYVVFVLSVVIWQFSWGGHLQMMFPVSFTVWLGQHIDLVYVLIAFTSGIFTYIFLDIRDTSPRLAPIIETCLAALAVLGACSIFNLIPPLWQNGLVFVVAILATSSYLLAGFESYLNHFYSSRYFILAWSLLGAGALIGIMNLIGVLPSNFFTTYCFQFSVFLQACLFSVALVDKTHSELEREIQQATDDLRNNMEFIEEQNVRLDIARKDAIKASHIKSQFLANMSHEIRTPLNAILGFSKELTQLSLSEEKQEQIRIINAAADSLLGIVNDVLDVSKIEAGKLQINNNPFSPNQLVEEMVSVMSKSAHQKNLEFVLDLDPLPNKLIGDVMRIKQILNNLLSNALKFTPTGYISLRVRGKSLEHGMYELTFNVEDTGIGISDTDRKKLFSAFSQVDDALSRSYQGTGLGLVICQQLVKLMRGTINLKSTPGEGSCFIISLRLNLLNANTALTTSENWRRKPVLLIDPNPFTRRASSRMLTLLGCRVTSAERMDFLTVSQHDANQRFDTLFLTLPHAYASKRQDTMELAAHFPVNNIVLLFSGAEPVFRSMHLESRVNGRIRLPLTPAKLDNLSAAPTESGHSQLQDNLQSLPRARVLAVDDMEMNLRLLKTWLKPSPLELTLAYSGEDAVSLCQKEEFDLILMDVQMPNMDGLQAAQAIRHTELNIGTPIIAVTAHAFKEEQERLLSSGMDDYLPKPLDLNELIVLIKRWCGSLISEPISVPSLDWDLAVTRANHNKDAAKDMLMAFNEQLPAILLQIESSWKTHDLTATQNLVHKLHGACCYTGVPKLQSLCDEIESKLKKNTTHKLAERISVLLSEGELVVSAIEKQLNDLGDVNAPDFGTA